MNPDLIKQEYLGKVGVLRLNRPARKNAFNKDLWEAFAAAIDNLYEKNLRAVVITGEGVFCAGFDVNPDNPQVASLINALNSGENHQVEEFVRYIRGITDRFAALPVPTIAAVNGLAYGGGAELAVRCDMRVIDPDATIFFSEVKLGLIPDWGGGVALTRRVGKARAAELVLTAKKITAQEAFQMGLANIISAPGRSFEEAVELADSIAKNGPQSIRAALKIIRQSPDMPLAEAMAFETRTAAECISTGECFHGIGAFMNKEKPDFPDA